MNIRCPNQAVHPHARGEHERTATIADLPDGSSPRTWGTLVLVLADLAWLRFIPTHVRNTLTLGFGVPEIPVHPHARGEHGADRSGRTGAIGSSPRTWGTPQIGVIGTLDVRFIPTHVGNTSDVQFYDFDHAVHPHARGEHVRETATYWSFSGSSPRTWGTLQDANARMGVWRFIPTHVGNTCVRLWPRNS